ncbi:MAG: hypothetical protein H7210_08150 [Pyrinomonadaceae bacterium]|nr:hypothetical protein [Phycisphaerales bacterium]
MGQHRDRSPAIARKTFKVILKKTKSSFVRALRVSALVVLLAGLGIWAAGGARVGWTQTTVVTLQRDEITGIDFPLRRRAFIAGVEVPVLAIAAALLVAGLSVFAQRRSIPVKA